MIPDRLANRRLTSTDVGALMREARRRSGLSRSDLARVGGTSRGAIDQIEKGARVPRVDTLLRLLDIGALELRLHGGLPNPGDLGQRSTLANFCVGLDTADDRWMWRTLTGDFVANEFVPASAPERQRMLEAEPTLYAHSGWSCFVAALADHLAQQAGIDSPAWTNTEERDSLGAFWWPVHGTLAATRASAMATSPGSFKCRKILVDRIDLPVVKP